MSNTQDAAQRGPEDETEADGRGRRWYHFRPVPRRRTDLMGFNTTWWVVWWLIFIVLIVYPGPYW